MDDSHGAERPVSAEAERLIELHIDWLTMKKKASQATINARRRLLRFADRRLPKGLLDVCESELYDLISHYEVPGNPTWTAYTYDTALRVFYSWAAAKGRAPEDPMIDLAKPAYPEPEPHPVSDEHLAILLNAPWPIPTITRLGRYQGLRRAEICGLYREDITQERTRIRRAKGGRRAWTPTHPEVWEHIQSLPVGPAVQLATGEIAHPVIYTRDGPVSPATLTKIWARARLRLGLPAWLVPHHNRHRFATDVHRETHDAFLTARALRQRRVASAEHYVGIDDDEVAAVVKAVGRPEPDDGRLGPPVTD